MIAQISMFELLDEYETPLLPADRQKAGTVAWVIEWSGLFLRKNGFKDDWHGVCTRPVILENDTDESKRFQAAHTIKGTHQGWYGGIHPLYAKRPTWNDCVLWARQHRKQDAPEEVRYYDRDGNWKAIYSYEEGW